MKELWVEKYRPKTIKEYVVRDDTQKKQIENWVKENQFHICYFTDHQVQVKQLLQKCC